MFPINAYPNRADETYSNYEFTMETLKFALKFERSHLQHILTNTVLQRNLFALRRSAAVCVFSFDNAYNMDS